MAPKVTSAFESRNPRERLRYYVERTVPREFGAILKEQVNRWQQTWR